MAVAKKLLDEAKAYADAADKAGPDVAGPNLASQVALFRRAVAAKDDRATAAHGRKVVSFGVRAGLEVAKSAPAKKAASSSRTGS